jgi:hypothetical protein
VMILFFEGNKIRKITSITIGVVHGLKGRAGRDGEIEYTAVSN